MSRGLFYVIFLSIVAKVEVGRHCERLKSARQSRKISLRRLSCEAQLKIFPPRHPVKRAARRREGSNRKLMDFSPFKSLLKIQT